MDIYELFESLGYQVGAETYLRQISMQPASSGFGMYEAGESGEAYWFEYWREATDLHHYRHASEIDGAIYNQGGAIPAWASEHEGAEEILVLLEAFEAEKPIEEVTEWCKSHLKEGLCPETYALGLFAEDEMSDGLTYNFEITWHHTKSGNPISQDFQAKEVAPTRTAFVPA